MAGIAGDRIACQERMSESIVFLRLVEPQLSSFSPNLADLFGAIINDDIINDTVIVYEDGKRASAEQRQEREKGQPSCLSSRYDARLAKHHAGSRSMRSHSGYSSTDLYSKLG